MIGWVHEFSTTAQGARALDAVAGTYFGQRQISRSLFRPLYLLDAHMFLATAVKLEFTINYNGGKYRSVSDVNDRGGLSFSTGPLSAHG
jgi:hypothetical protein